MEMNYISRYDSENIVDALILDTFSDHLSTQKFNIFMFDFDDLTLLVKKEDSNIYRSRGMVDIEGRRYNIQGFELIEQKTKKNVQLVYLKKA